MIKRIVCFFKGHKWEAYYRGNNKICGRCEKEVSFGKVYPPVSWPEPLKKELCDVVRERIMPEIIEALKVGLHKRDFREALGIGSKET